MVCANCDFGSYPELQILIKPYVTKEVGGRRIGIIGFLTTDTGVSATQLLWYTQTGIDIFIVISVCIKN